MEGAGVTRLAKEASDRFAAVRSGQSTPLTNLTGHVALAFIALTGGATIIGWKWDIPALVRAGPDIVPMQLNTALCFLLTALSILLIHRGYRRAAIAWAGLVFVIAAVSGAQYLGEWDFGIDRLFDDPFITDRMSHPGRMAPNTSLMFLCLSLAVASRGIGYGGSLGRDCTTTLCVIVLGYCIIVLFAYFAGIEGSYQWRDWTAMAVQTGFCFALLAFVMLQFSWQEDRATDELQLFPAWVSRALFIMLCAAAIGAWHGLSASVVKSARSEAQTALVSLEHLLSLALDDKFAAFIRLADRFQAQGMKINQAFLTDVGNYLEWQPELSAVAVLDGGGSVLWKSSGGDEKDEADESHVDSLLTSLFFETREPGDPSEIYREATLLPLVLENRRHIAFLFRRNETGDQEGRLLAFVYDADLLIELVTSSVRRSGFAYEVRIGSLVLSGQRPEDSLSADVRPLSGRLTFNEADIQIRVWPGTVKRAALQGAMPEVVLILGILSAALSSGTLSLLRRSRRQEQLTLRVNDRLELEVTARRRSETDLRKLKQRLELILESAGEGIFGLSRDGRTTFANSAAERATGWGREEMFGRMQHEVIHHSHADGSPYPRDICPIYATLSDGAVHKVDTEVFWRRDGSSFPVEYIASPIIDDEGGVEGAVVVFRDIADRLEKEAALKLAYQELAATNRELEVFCYSVSHDLRAPLRAIGGFSEVLVEDFGERLESEGRGYLERIRAAASRMSELIDDLLKLSRLTRQEIEEQNVDLSRIAQEVLDELQDGDPGHKVQLDIEEGCRVAADSKLMRAVLQNLLGNAWKFTRRTENPQIEFGLGDTSQDGKPSFYVRDNGAGFDMAYAEKLFAPFQRLHRTSEFEGTGVGLAIVQRALHRQGGRVWAESEPGKGAAFHFEV